MSYPSLSIIIPTYNGAQTLPELLAMLSVQTVPIQELIIVDSSSTDQTAAIVEEHGAELITIDKKEFEKHEKELRQVDKRLKDYESRFLNR